MQNFEQVKDVIQYIKMIHDRLRKLYVSLNENARSEREKMLLDYLIEQQTHLEDMLANFEVSNQQSVLDNWMQFTPSIDIHQLIDDQNLLSVVSFEAIVELADSLSQALIGFYREAANESELPKVRMIFENLADMAINDNRKQNRAALFEAI
jgi:rubrerythrin